MEILARVAKIKYQEGKGDIKVKTLPEAIELFLMKDVYPNTHFTAGWHFRTQHLYNTKVNELLRKNLPVIEKIYKSSNSIINYHPKKRFITIQECREYCHKMGLTRISDAIIGICYYESMITIADPVKNLRQEELQINEFLVFMCRITFEHYKGSHYHNERMYIKLEKMLPNWLAPVYQIPEFGFNHEFEYDLKMARKKKKAARKAEGLSTEEEEGFDDISDSDEEEEAQTKSPAGKGKQSGAVSPVPELAAEND